MDFEDRIQFKNMIDALAGVAETMGGVVDQEGIGMLARFDIAKYLMYLSCTDGTLSYEEVEIVNDILDLNLSTQELADFIETEGIFTSQFEETIPPSLEFLVKVDNAIHEQNEMMDTFGSEALFSAFETAGNVQISADGYADSEEEREHQSYLDMLRNYLQSNLVGQACLNDSPESDEILFADSRVFVCGKLISEDNYSDSEAKTYYSELSANIDNDEYDYRSRNLLIELLESSSCYAWACDMDCDLAEAYRYKRNAFARLIEVWDFYSAGTFGPSEQAIRLQLQSHLAIAQANILLGEFDESFRWYMDFLKLPAVRQSISEIKKEYFWESRFSLDDLDLVLQVLFNMNQILSIVGTEECRGLLYDDYEILIERRREQDGRMVTQSGMEQSVIDHIWEETDALLGRRNIPMFYFKYSLSLDKLDDTSFLTYGFMQDGTPHRVSIDDEVLYDITDTGILFHDDIDDSGFSYVSFCDIDLDEQRFRIREILGKGRGSSFRSARVQL